MTRRRQFPLLALLLALAFLGLQYAAPATARHAAAPLGIYGALGDQVAIALASPTQLLVNGLAISDVDPADTTLLVLEHVPIDGSGAPELVSAAAWHDQTVVALDQAAEQLVSRAGTTSSLASQSGVETWTAAPHVRVVAASANRATLVVAVPKARVAITEGREVDLADVLPTAVLPNTRVTRVDADSAATAVRSAPVPDRLVEVLRKHKKPTRGDKRIRAMLKKTTIPEMRADVEWLTGEDPNSPLTTRHSLSDGHLVAAKWMREQMTKYGCDMVELMEFRDGYGPNVVCTIEGTELPDEHVVLGAHLDSRGSVFWPYSRAPGGDDDGSGTAMILNFMRVLHSSKLRLRRTLKVISFAGEEQGLIGSKAYARAARERGDRIIWMLQGDMLAYRKPGEPLQCGLPDRYMTPEANLVVRKVAEAYVPEVQVGSTSACCSDHQSFFENGFASTQIFERNGPIADPMYHNSGDLSRRVGYDFEQLQALARVALATTMVVAEIAEP
ncbi:hypothetical protein GGF32_008649 [Allomyces javanicus]|nr:hypothetical protein GGF32_008649 [Allomyces javanicus]